MNKPFWFEKFGAVAFVSVFLWLAYIALTEQAVTTGSPKTGMIHTTTGDNAIWLGLVFAGIALASLGYLAKYNGFRNLIWLLLTLSWVGFVIGYLL